MTLCISLDPLVCSDTDDQTASSQSSSGALSIKRSKRTAASGSSARAPDDSRFFRSLSGGAVPKDTLVESTPLQDQPLSPLLTESLYQRCPLEQA